jgi:hypothetical protein
LSRGLRDLKSDNALYKFDNDDGVYDDDNCDSGSDGGGGGGDYDYTSQPTFTL